jgi:intracellular multiplication protein IcmV
MNEKKKGIIRRSFKSMIDVRRWVAWDEVVGSGKAIISLAKDIFKMPKKRPLTKETFEETVKRLNLTDEEIVSRMRVNLHLTIIYLVMALGLFIYLIHSLVKGHLLAAFISAILDILVLAYAFRTHLLYIQMKERKVCHSFKEWFEFTFKARVRK